MRFSRRGFLGAVPAGLAGLNRLAAAPPKLPVGCRDAMLRELGAPDCWSAAKSVGAEVIEVSVDDKFNLPLLLHPQRKYSLSTDEEMKQLSNDLQAAKLRISAFCVATRFFARPDFECDFLAKLARISQQLGVKAIRIDVVSSTLTAEQFLDPSVAALKKLIEATEGTGVKFGVENHGPSCNNSALLSPLLDRVGSKRLGVTLDTGNFYWFGHPLAKVYELIETFAPRVVHTHCKNIRYPAEQREVQRPMGWEYARYEAPIDQGDIDFKRVVRILRAAGYAGDLCVENEGLHRLPESERVSVLAREIGYLKRLRG
jgi:sugar phosphate isomerase/epimerase